MGVGRFPITSVKSGSRVEFGGGVAAIFAGLVGMDPSVGIRLGAGGAVGGREKVIAVGIAEPFGKRLQARMASTRLPMMDKIFRRSIFPR